MNEHTKPPSIREVIRTLNLAEDANVDFIIACAFNLYIESIKRIHGRVLLSAADVHSMFAMVDMLMTERQHEEAPEARTRKLTEEEEKVLLGAIEAPLNRRG